MPEAAGTTAIAKAKVDLNLPAKYDEAIAAEAAAMASRLAAPGGDIIRINKEKSFTLPSGETADTLEIVVVDFVSMNQYYPGKFDAKNVQPPVCMALGVDRREMRPFASSPKPQSADCPSCWANQWSSDGGKGKACKDQRLLALLAPAMQDDGPLMILKVSPTGTKFWDRHVFSLANMLNTTPVKVLTRITFDETLDYASLRFSAVGPNDGWATAFGRHAEARKRLLTEQELAPLEVAPAPAGKR